MLTRVRDFLHELPRWAKVLAAVLLFASVGYQASAAVVSVVAIPSTVAEHDRWIENTEPMLKFLVCRSIEQDAGRTPGACVFLLRDSNYYSEFVRLGLIKEQ